MRRTAHQRREPISNSDTPPSVSQVSPEPPCQMYDLPPQAPTDRKPRCSHNGDSAAGRSAHATARDPPARLQARIYARSSGSSGSGSPTRSSRRRPAAICANACCASCATTSNSSRSTKTETRRQRHRAVLQDAVAIVDQHLRGVQNKQHKEIAKAIGRPYRGRAARSRLHSHSRSSPRPAIQQSYRRA
jgi:hypothetical protein